MIDFELGVHRKFLTISNNYKYFLERKSVFLSLIDERLVSIMSTIKAIYGDRVSKEYNAYWHFHSQGFDSERFFPTFVLIIFESEKCQKWMGKMRNEAHLRFPVFTLRSVQFSIWLFLTQKHVSSCTGWPKNIETS